MAVSHSPLRVRRERPVEIRRMAQQPANVAHDHPFWELVIVIAGHGEHVTAAGSDRLGVGDVFVIEPGHAHRYRSVDALHIVNVLLHPLEDWFDPMDLAGEPGWHALFTLEPQLRHRHNFRSRLRLTQSQLRRVDDLLGEMEQLQHSGGPGHARALATRFGLLLELLVSARGSRRSEERRELLRLADTLAAIERQPEQPWPVHRLCRLAGCSPSTLQRAFRRAVGHPPSQWILRRRIDHACRLLRDPRLTITAAASASGFDDPNYFARQFRRILGCSPRAWRRGAGPGRSDGGADRAT